MQVSRIAAFLVVALSCPCLAQFERWRGTEAQGELMCDARLFGCYVAKSAKDVEFAWLEGSPGVERQVTLDLGTSYFGDCVVVSAAIGPDGTRLWPSERVLFVGQDSAGAGVVVLTGYENGTHKVLARTTFPGRKFVGVGYSIPHKKIYLLDAQQQMILRGVFDPALNLLPSSVVPCVTAAQCPDLSNAASMTLCVGCETEADPGILLGRWPEPVRGTYWRIWDRASGPVCTSHPGALDLPKFTNPTLPFLEGQTTVDVAGEAGRAFDVLEFTSGVIVGSGSVGGSGQSTVTVSPLQMGQVYGVVDVLTQASRGPFRTPQKQWGFPEVLSDGFSIRALSPNLGLLAEIGRDDMAPALWMGVPGTPPAIAKQWTGWLLVGTEAEVLPIGGGQYAVVSNLAIQDSVHWTPGWEKAVGALKMAAPTDPSLDGVVVCFQWMVLDGQNLRFSNVVGVMLRASKWEPEAVATLGLRSPRPALSATSSSIAWTSANLGKVGVWLLKGGVKPLPGHVWSLLVQARR